MFVLFVYVHYLSNIHEFTSCVNQVVLSEMTVVTDYGGCLQTLLSVRVLI